MGLTWREGASFGGSPVIDYIITYGEVDGSYTEEISLVVPTEYIVTGLTAGIIYKFRVQARNAYFISDYSDEEIVLAAQFPDQPAAPTTEINSDNVLIKWVAPFDQGSPLNGYQVWIL